MNSRQFLIFIEMLESIRLQLGSVAANSELRPAEYAERAEIQAEQALKDARYLDSLPPGGTG